MTSSLGLTIDPGFRRDDDLQAWLRLWWFTHNAMTDNNVMANRNIEMCRPACNLQILRSKWSVAGQSRTAKCEAGLVHQQPLEVGCPGLKNTFSQPSTRMHLGHLGSRLSSKSLQLLEATAAIAAGDAR